MIRLLQALKSVICQQYLGSIQAYHTNKFYQQVLKQVGYYKNPNSISRFGEWVRGVIDKRGDLYVVDKNVDIIHQDIIRALTKKFSVSSLPDSENIYKNLDKIVLVQRYFKTNQFHLADCYFDFTQVGPTGDDEITMMPDKIKQTVKHLFDLCKRKNPNIEFKFKVVI